MFISKLAIALVTPLGTALFLGLLALLLGLAKRLRLSMTLGAAALVWLWLWSLPAISLGLRAHIEGEFPAVQIQDLPAADVVIVLGGMMTPAENIERSWPNLNAAADRVWHAARIYRAGKAPLILLSGGTDHGISQTSEAESMRLILRDFGVPNEAIVLEGKSRNTRENARFTAKLLAERGIETALLVTSALHMKRAKMHFDAEGLNVIPAATDYEARTITQWERWLPDTNALDGSGRAIKEIVGRIVNR